MQKKKSRGGNNINNVRKLQQQSRRKQQQQQKQQHEQNQQRKQQQITTTTKKKKIKHRHFLLMIFFVLSCFVLLPILFLQHQLQIDHHSNHHNSPVNEHLMQEFYTKKQQRQKHLLKSSSKSSSTSRTIKNNDDPPSNLILTTYSEPIDTIIIEQQQTSSPSNKPSFIRNTSSSILKRREYPRVKNCLSIMEDFPIDDYPMDDPYLPWIHDYFISHTGTAIKFVAQNKRRCGPTTTTNDDDSKKDDNMATFLKKWDRQYALFQSIPIVVEEGDNNNNNKNNTTKTKTKTRYRFATSREEATYPSTRFQCRFHSPTSGTTTTNITTFSEYPFDYEFVHWRKQKKSMLDTSKEPSKDMPSFWLSQLLFSCPIPIQYQNLIKIINNNSNNRDDDDDGGEKSKYDSSPIFYLDLVPIRTPVRSNLFLNESQTGPGSILSTPLFDPQTEFGYQHYLPPIQNSGRWANLPICSTNHRSTGNDNNNKNNAVNSVVVDEKDSSQQQEQSNVKKEYRLVGCTWTAASYTRRGDAVRVSDSAKRLEEWIRFHLMVGVQHLYVYDNSPPTAFNNGNNDDKISTTELKKVTDKFPPTQVTYHRWTCQICNNNRPAHKNPGERSSQYAAEASCRERYGPLTEWMTFVDTDELLIPMKANEKGEYKWDTILDEMDAKQINIMKFLSSRGKPRIDLMEELVDQSQCIDADPNSKKKMKNGPPQPCKGPRSNETFLKVYNCDYIRPRKPNRFARAMKQIYKPSHVLSHFVHYSTVTADAAITYEEFMNNKKSSSATSSTIQQQQFVPFVRDKKWEKQSPELFLDELTQGALIHARSILPHETMNVNETCYVGSKLPCNVGFLCDDTVQFVNSIHKDNVFQNPTTGSYCNCWRNPVVDNVLVPLLEKQFH